jgi:hypothetical protein
MPWHTQSTDNSACGSPQYAEVDLSTCDTSDHADCAKEQCAHSGTEVDVWVPLDYTHHPYTCCPVG